MVGLSTWTRVSGCSIVQLDLGFYGDFLLSHSDLCIGAVTGLGLQEV